MADDSQAIITFFRLGKQLKVDPSVDANVSDPIIPTNNGTITELSSKVGL